MALRKVHIKKVIGPTSNGTAVLLGDSKKTFVMFIGQYEGAAIIRELNDEATPRPLTHDLLSHILLGFDIQVKRIVITDLVKNIFHATIILEQKCTTEGGEWNGKRNEVRIDARPSDCLVIALKEKADIWVSDQVLEKVRDVSQEIHWTKETPSDTEL